MRWGHTYDISYYLKQQEGCRKFQPTPLSFIPTILQLCQMPHLTRRTLWRQNALAKEHHFALQNPFFFYLFPPGINCCYHLCSPCSSPQPYSSISNWVQQLSPAPVLQPTALVFTIVHIFLCTPDACTKSQSRCYTASISSFPLFPENPHQECRRHEMDNAIL